MVHQLASFSCYVLNHLSILHLQQNFSGPYSTHYSLILLLIISYRSTFVLINPSYTLQCRCQLCMLSTKIIPAQHAYVNYVSHLQATMLILFLCFGHAALYRSCARDPSLQTINKKTNALMFPTQHLNTLPLSSIP